MYDRVILIIKSEVSMKENRNGIYATLILLFISILGAAAITYDARLSALFIHPEFIVNCFLGIFTGAVLSFYYINIKLFGGKTKNTDRICKYD